MSLNITEWCQQILGHFVPYWSLLKNCFWRLKKAVLAKATHAAFITILQETLASLTDDEDSTDGDDLRPPNGDITSEDIPDDDSDSSGSGYDSPIPATGSNSQRTKRTSDIFTTDDIVLVNDFPPLIKWPKKFHSMGS